MGLAKKKMFGRSSVRYPNLQKLIDRGVLLPIDVAYAEAQSSSKGENALAEHAALLSLLRSGALVLKKDLIEDPLLASMIEKEQMLPKYQQSENKIIDEIIRLLSFPKKDETTPPLESLTDEQNLALINAKTQPLSLITGGPGTGKTYTASHIVEALGLPTILTAPTGKAAANLEKNINFPVLCGTLHSLLKIRTPLDYYREIETLEAGLVIVDECSMIDPLLFARLLSSIGPETNVVLMGDVNQLPAVEGGSIFADLIDSQRIPTTTLTRCMRSDRKEILELAQSILKGDAEDIRSIDLGFGAGDLETIYNNLWNQVKDRDFGSFRILSTLRKGPLGVDALNRFLFEKFCSNTDQFPIMIKKNDPKTGLANGDTGILMSGGKALINDQEFLLSQLPSYEYAYCISVHKSQGSEYEQVLFIVPDGSESFGKEVIYTAVTRAKKILEIDGNPEQIAKALSRSSRKYSTLSSRLHINLN